jgi:hypothetical protein
VRLVFPGGPVAAKVMQAAASGRTLDPAWVSSPVAKSTLTGAAISSVQAGSGGEDRIFATVNFEKVDHEFVRR